MAATWEVTQDLPDQYGPATTGIPPLGHVISFITGNGKHGSIFVANEQYHPNLVRPMLQAQANLADEIGTMVSKT